MAKRRRERGGKAGERADAARGEAHGRVPLGVRALGGATRFGVYAPAARACSVRLFAPDGRAASEHAMAPEGEGYFAATIDGVGHGARYTFVLDGRELPDPYARFLPDGVHAPAMIVEPRYEWRFGTGVSRPLSEHVIYELHVGTFTEEGTYAAAERRLGYLAELGVTAIELMPIAAFAGGRGWGYDGVAHYAPFAPYGTPDELRRFVDEAHGRGLAVLLDVVYNHLGPSGNYLAAYSPAYFTREHTTPWGVAPRFAYAPMRRYAVENAVYWLEEFRFDGLRLDATHAVYDRSRPHVLRELADRVRALAPRKVIIAEDDRNDPQRMERLGFDAVWADDFHHQLHATLTGERDGYYAAYEPGAAGIARAIERGWLYEGRVYPPTGRRRGRPATGIPAEALVYCLQNHDQIGNRAFGERLSSLVSIDAYCAASALLLFLPMTPLLFMGQEWAASTPFLFFTDHEPGLGARVRAGRLAELASFEAFSDPARQGAIADPQARETFEWSRLRWDERHGDPHRRVLALYRDLLALRRSDPVLRDARRERLRAEARGDVLVVRRWSDAGERVLAVNFGKTEVPLSGLPLDCSRTASILRTSPGPEAVLPGEGAILFASSAA